MALVEDEDGLARENGLEIYYRDVTPYLTRLRLKFPEIATLIVVRLIHKIYVVRLAYNFQRLYELTS